MFVSGDRMSMTPRARPIALLTHFALLTAAVAAQAGTLADSNGVLLAWGRNDAGQANVPPGRYVAVSMVGGTLALAVREDGSLAAWGTAPPDSVTTLPAGTYTAIAGGLAHAVALRSDGTLVPFGSSYVGQGAVPAGSFVAVASGSGANHSVALRADGSLAAWGLSPFGQTSAPVGTFSAVAAGGGHSLALRSDGTLAGWGANFDGQRTVPSGSFVAVAAGLAHSLAIRQDGTLAGWGANESGQRTVPNGIFTAVAGGNAHSLGIRDDGSLAGWGANGAGQSAVPAGSFVAVAAQGDTSYALEARTVYTENLEVFGRGMTANFNRDVRVAGNLQVLYAQAKMFNASTISVAGDLQLVNSSSEGVGTYRILGRTWVAGQATLTGATLQSLGDLSGAGALTLQDATASFGLAANNRYTGNLLLRASQLSFSGNGEAGAFSLTLDAGSRFTIGPGQRFVSPFTNVGGVAEVVQGELSTDQIRIDPTGRLTGRDATLQPGEGVDVRGTLAFSGGRNVVNGSVTNWNRVEVSEGADARFEGNFANAGNLTLRRFGGAVSSAVITGAFSGTGSVSGGGNLQLEGELAPGGATGSIGAMQIVANLQLGPGSRTVIDIGGSDMGQHDWVLVDGNLDLDGTLAVAEFGSFALGANRRFNVLTTTGNVTGEFTDLADGARVGTFGGVDLYIDYTPEGVVLFAPVPEAGTLPMLALGMLALGLARRQRPGQDSQT
jgi:Regulator of chromosome condensation (RCC1) repeat